MLRIHPTLFVATCMSLLSASVFGADEAATGLFESHQDIGNPAKPGAVEYNATAGTYLITGGGGNIWAATDSFHYVWKQVSGDVALTADIKFPEPGGDPHRKSALMIRQSLDPQSPYVDVALHGNGLASLQFRETPGGATHEIQGNVTAPGRLRIEKRGEYFTMFLGNAGEDLKLEAGSPRVTLKEPFYVGLAVCAHNNAVSEKALFSNVEITDLSKVAVTRTNIECTLETIALSSRDRRVVYHAPPPLHIEAPNWTKDGKSLIYNQSGRIYKIALTNGTPEVVDTGTSTRCNNDHGISADGTMLAISDSSRPGGSRVYVLPFTGGTPKLLTPLAPSYFHGWSPDGKTLAFCAQRPVEVNGVRTNDFDVYTVSVDGGEEKRLTTSRGLDDGPEYSPDGKYIYFNSMRSGLMQIWRMKPDGSEQEQVTSDDYNNWFAHPSPDGRWLAFISFPKEVSPSDHPANKNVTLRLKPVDGNGPIQVLATMFGGQGTMNVGSWSPDSRSLAFVSYQTVYH